MLGFLGFKVCLASELTGVLENNGEPIPNAIVTRLVKLNSTKITQSSQADAKDCFSFEPVFTKKFLKKLSL